jgi:hypothetical protein
LWPTGSRHFERPPGEQLSANVGKVTFVGAGGVTAAVTGSRQRASSGRFNASTASGSDRT